MDKLKEFFSANKKGVAIGTAILFLLFGLLASSDKEKTEVPEENTVATTLDQSSEFDLSLGGLKILIPKEKLYEVKGNEKKIENFPDSNYPFYIYDNMSVAVDKDMVLGIIAYADKPEVKTEKNIHPGSTVEEFLTAYGRECIFHEGGDVDGDGSDTFQYVFKSKDGNNFALLTFHVLDEKVKNIELGLIGEDIYNGMAKEVTTYADTVRKGEFPISIAGIKLGSTAKDLDNSQSYFSDKNFEEKVNDDGTVRRKYTDLIVTFENGVIQGLVTHTDKLATGEKIRKGSNVEEVLNAYGDSCSVSKYNGLTLLEYVYDSPKNRTAVLRFAMNGNIVDYISLRTITADERKNLLSVNKNLRQELEQEKQRQAEAQRQAELQRQQEQERQRQAELERQRQSQPKEVFFVHYENLDGNLLITNDNYVMTDSIQTTNNGFNIQTKSETIAKRINTSELVTHDVKYHQHAFLYQNGHWYHLFVSSGQIEPDLVDFSDSEDGVTKMFNIANQYR